MPTLGERWQNLWDHIQHSPAQIPARLTIPRERVDHGPDLGGPFQRDMQYFQVRVNELYLSSSREWFSHYDPLVFVVTEFTYDKQAQIVPFIVGPVMLEKFGQKLPNGMLFANTRVAGLHPYRGGRISLSVILCRVQRDNNVHTLLRLIESTASALDFATALSSYLKVAEVVLDGVESLLGLGGTGPLIGIRADYDPDAGDRIEPTYFVLINEPEHQIEPNQFWVRDNRLYYGPSSAGAQPFRGADYVLYSLVGTAERSDVQILPFYPLVEQVNAAATQPDDDSWRRAKASMLTLFQALVLSPDLTPGQATSLGDDYKAEMLRLHDIARSLGALGPEATSALPSEVDEQLREAVNILDL